MKRENLKARLLRALAGLSQVQMARRIGRSAAQIDQWERGNGVPGAEDLKLLAEQGAEIALEDADELLDLYETQRQAFRRRSAGAGSILDDLAARLGRFCVHAVRRLLKLPLPERQASPEDRPRAEEQLAALRRLRPSARLAVVRFTRDYQSWVLVEGCCAASEEEASRSLQSAADWARVALVIAKCMSGPLGWRDRVRAYALAHWANVLRVRGKLKTAETCLEKARRLWAAGADPSGLLDPGRLLDLEGSLRRDQRRFDEALDLFQQAEPVSRFPERVLLKKGFTYEVMGDYRRAIATLLEAEPLVERRGDTRLIYMLRFNLATNYCHLGRYAKAAELVHQVRELVVQRDDRIEANRVIWLEGRILAGLGHPEEARRLLAEARQRFAAEKMFYDVALALLDEAGLLLDQGRTGEVKVLTLELTEVFQSKGVHREALAALRLFQEAAEREAATAELARRVLRYLFRARHDQGLRFDYDPSGQP
jgi:tetratricopeptide (TPR) repeat protein